MCGEPVENFPIGAGRSDVPAGLPDWVNDRNNWAARGMLLFEPTLDTTFVLGGHGARRNELTRLGQSYGTVGAFYCLNANFAECDIEYPVGSKVFNALGGTQGLLGGGYQPIEVKMRMTELAPCYRTVSASIARRHKAVARAATIRSTRPGSVTPRQSRSPRTSSRISTTSRGQATSITSADHERHVRLRFKSTTILPAELELSTVTGYDRYFRKVDIDLDFSPSTLFHILTRDHGRQFYQDIKLTGETPILADTPVSWDIGGWILDEQIDVNVVNDFGRATAFAIGQRDYTQELTSMAGYGAFSFDFWEDFTLDGGVRWNFEQKDIDYRLEESGGSLVTELTNTTTGARRPARSSSPIASAKTPTPTGNTIAAGSRVTTTPPAHGCAASRSPTRRRSTRGRPASTRSGSAGSSAAKPRCSTTTTRTTRSSTPSSSRTAAPSSW
jgi:hypothetical protein